MNYQVHYDRLIARAREYDLLIVGYTERHHVLPRCLGGGDEAVNIVRLTPEEHYVAHQLLVKMHPGNHKVVFAACMLTWNLRGKRSRNKQFGWLRRLNAEASSFNMKGKPKSAEQCVVMSLARTGDKNVMFGRPVSAKTREKLRVAGLGHQRFLGGRHSEEANERIRKAKTLYWKGLTVEQRSIRNCASWGKVSLEERSKKAKAGWQTRRDRQELGL